MRGSEGHEDFNRDNFNRNDFNHNDLNRGDVNSFNAGEAVGADRGAAYGAAAATGAEGAIPGDPNAAEQNMLYYSGVQNMNQGH
ncbi:MAG: hypothetical protein HWD61_02000 [Parachlamydiaceae bacterium]|nr:MAG: hypothetical protein HWD61_02000 [Parachlamydiaceae bacterium]